MAGRGRAFLFANQQPPSEQTESPAAPANGAPKPRGRATFLQASRSDDSSSNVSGPSGSGDSSIESGLSFSSGDHSGGDSSTRPKAMGRASLFTNKSSSSGVYTDVSADLQKLSVAEEPQVQKRVSPDMDKPPPVMRHGTNGTKVDVAANYVQLDLIDQERGIWEYDVIFSPEVDHKIAKIRLVNRHFMALGGKAKVFDGGSRLWTPMDTEKEFASGEYELNNGEKIEVTFKRRRLKKFVECHRILNIIMQRIKGELQLVRFGRSDYNPHQCHAIPEHKLEVWPGCITAVEEYEGGILLNCDASHRVLQSNTVLDIIMEICNMRRGKNMSSSFEDDVSKALLGLSVITKYNNRIVRIDDVDFDKKPASTFEKNGKQISYVEYYQTQYNLVIRDHGQPLLVSRVKKKPQGKENVEILNYYVPELCSPTGLTDAQRGNFRLMKDVAKITQVIPVERERALTEFLKGIYANENCKKILADWGLKLPTQSIRLIARTLEPETIIFAKGRKVQEPKADWSRALSNNEVLAAIHIEDWAIVYTARDTRIASNFYDKCKEISRKCGIKVAEPRNIKIDNDRPQTYCAEIKKHEDCQIVVIIFPSQRDDRYSAVKKLCNVDLGLPSQVVNAKTLSKDSRALTSIVSKILLQMNCKLGGALWGVNIPYKEDGIMFCGVDAYHEAGRRGASIIALVTTINPTATRWTSATASHSPGQEISDFITNLFRDCLREWFKLNGSYPKRIIMFRDGVGDGQLKVVRDFEIPQMKRMFSQVHNDYNPVLTYMVVQKRINTRFYTAEVNRATNQTRYQNPPPGTVLDHTITRRDWYDFFLVSQNVNQGTVAPTHYVVIEDNSGMTTDQVQKIAYRMTHLYYNWNGTVRVPAPCQYAHKLAYLVGQHVHAVAHENLRNTLYFL